MKKKEKNQLHRLDCIAKHWFNQKTIQIQRPFYWGFTTPTCIIVITFKVNSVGQVSAKFKSQLSNNIHQGYPHYDI